MSLFPNREGTRENQWAQYQGRSRADIPFIQGQTGIGSTGHSWTYGLANPDKFYGFPYVLSATKSHYFAETDSSGLHSPSNCGGGQPLPQGTPPNADTSEQLFSEARPRLLPV